MTTTTLASLHQTALAKWTPSADDLTKWGTDGNGKLTVFDATNLASAFTGLYGNDLTDFKKACADAGASICNSADYNNFSGWAVGVQFVTNKVTTIVEFTRPIFGYKSTGDLVSFEFGALNGNNKAYFLTD